MFVQACASRFISIRKPVVLARQCPHYRSVALVALMAEDTDLCQLDSARRLVQFGTIG